MCRIAHCNACLRVIIPIKMDHFNTARHLTKLPSRYLGGSFRLYMLRKCDYFVAGLIHLGLISSL